MFFPDEGFHNSYSVELFLNGEYEGLYCLSDKVDRKLLGLKKADKGTSGRVYIKGLLYKCTKWSGSSSYLTGYDTAPVNTTEWNAWELQYPSDYPSDVTWQPLMDLIDFCSQETTFAQFCDEYLNWFYVDNLVDYLVFTSAPGYYDPNPERVIYLPDGRRVNSLRDAVPGKGLYIIDGKKIYNR